MHRRYSEQVDGHDVVGTQGMDKPLEVAAIPACRGEAGGVIDAEADDDEVGGLADGVVAKMFGQRGGADAVDAEGVPVHWALVALGEGAGGVSGEALMVVSHADAGGGGFAHHQQAQWWALLSAGEAEGVAGGFGQARGGGAGATGLPEQ